jgi:hypothetical protein
MKFVGFAVVVGAVSAMTAGRLMGQGVSLTSPDHPAIWYNPVGDRVEQYLTWDRAKGVLMLNVAYDEEESRPVRDQFYYDSFHLSFPMVRLDEATNRLYVPGGHGGRVFIGHLEPGMMGNRVVLNDDLEFAAHRDGREIHATIVSHGPAR